MTGGLRFGKFIILKEYISMCYGTSYASGLPHGGDGTQFFARGGKDVPHPARDFTGAATAGTGAGREADRPHRQGSDPHRRRPHGARIRPPVPELKAGAR